ncbi:MAG: hypothetical protein PVF17_04420 [Ignavibacteria bacterium]|jgi:hypothetical protein
MKKQEYQDRKNSFIRKNTNKILEINDQIEDIYKNKGIVTKIIEGKDISNHGTIYILLDNGNEEHYVHYNWQTFIKILNK